MEAEPNPRWDLDQIGRDLQADREVAESGVFGYGASYEVRATQLQVYPKGRHIDIRTRQLLIGLSQIDLLGSDASNGDLILQSTDSEGLVTTIWLSSDGSVILRSSPPPTLDEAVQAAARPRLAPSPSPLIESPESAGSAPPAETIRTVAEDTPAALKTGLDRQEGSGGDEEEGVEEEIPKGAKVALEKQPRGTYLGRTGRKIVYKTVRDYKNQEQEMLVCEFMLHLDSADGIGQWIKVSAFREDAKRCQEQLKGGGVVSIVGYKHIKKWTDEKGVAHIREEIYSGHTRIL
jgi:hypothetical protein